jgi:hypothetical protein
MVTAPFLYPLKPENENSAPERVKPTRECIVAQPLVPELRRIGGAVIKEMRPGVISDHLPVLAPKPRNRLPSGVSPFLPMTYSAAFALCRSNASSNLRSALGRIASGMACHPRSSTVTATVGFWLAATAPRPTQSA